MKIIFGIRHIGLCLNFLYAREIILTADLNLISTSCHGYAPIADLVHFIGVIKQLDGARKPQLYVELINKFRP